MQSCKISKMNGKHNRTKLKCDSFELFHNHILWNHFIVHLQSFHNTFPLFGRTQKLVNNQPCILFLNQDGAGNQSGLVRALPGPAEGVPGVPPVSKNRDRGAHP